MIPEKNEQDCAGRAKKKKKVGTDKKGKAVS